MLWRCSSRVDREHAVEGRRPRAEIPPYYTDPGGRIHALESASPALRDLTRRPLPGRLVREAQQCMWGDRDRRAGLTTDRSPFPTVTRA